MIQKHAYVVEREKMLRGEPAREQGVIIDGVNFLNNSDLDGTQLPPAGAPNIMMAAGGTQLEDILEDDVILVWKYHVDWDDPTKTRVDGPLKIQVAPYQYLGGGQLTECVPQPGTEQHLDAQGDKIMARLVYRRIGDRESIVAVHSVATSAGGGGVRWYEFRLDEERDVNLYQQGTYAPEGNYRWMASPAIDGRGNIGIGYSFGGPQDYVGQRFAGRLLRRSSGCTDFTGGGPHPGGSGSDRHPAMGGLHPDRHRSERRPYHLVCGRLPQRGRLLLFDPDRCIPIVRLWQRSEITVFSFRSFLSLIHTKYQVASL